MNGRIGLPWIVTSRTDSRESRSAIRAAFAAASAHRSERNYVIAMAVGRVGLH